MKQFELIIFDCDGVLVDSERLSNEVGRQLLDQLGLPLTRDQMAELFIGRSAPDCAVIIEQMLGKPLPADFSKEYERRVLTAFSDHLEPIAGVQTLLSELALPRCVASNASSKETRLKLALTGLTDHVGNQIFSGVEVARPKPAPDVYLEAATQMGYRPSQCLVVEDSATGIEAAVAAGMTVVGFAGSMTAERLLAAGAACVIEHMSELATMIRSPALMEAIVTSRTQPRM